MNGNHTPFALPVRLEQPEQWPFALMVIAADGSEVIEERRFAHASGDKSVADAMECARHGGDREVAAAGNKAQVEKLEFIVLAVNSHDALVEALWAALNYANEQEVSSADFPRPLIEAVLAKAEGRP